MGYQPSKYTCAVKGVIKRFGMTGMCGAIACGSDMCTSKEDCQYQVPIKVDMSNPPKED